MTMSSLRVEFWCDGTRLTYWEPATAVPRAGDNFLINGHLYAIESVFWRRDEVAEVNLTESNDE